MKPPPHQAIHRPPARWPIAATLAAVLLGTVASPGLLLARAADPVPVTNASGSARSTPAAANSPAPTNAPSAPGKAPTNSTSSSEAVAGDAAPTKREPERDRSDRRPRTGDRRRSGSDREGSVGSGGAGETSGSRTNDSTGRSFSSFRIIADRNIFNPNRGRDQGRSDRDSGRKAVQVDLITLVGALSYARGDVAFFEGSSSQFRKTLKCGDSIAGFTVRSIAPSRVKLEGGDRTLEMTVGAQLRREDGGEWKFIARADATTVPTGAGSGGSPGAASLTSSGSSAGATGAAPTADAAAAANEILQRLMKKREQEMK